MQEEATVTKVKEVEKQAKEKKEIDVMKELNEKQAKELEQKAKEIEAYLKEIEKQAKENEELRKIIKELQNKE